MTASIRLATEADSAAIAMIYAPYCISTPVSFEEIAPTSQEMAERIRKITQQYPWLALDEGGILAGYAYASQHRQRPAYRWSVDVSVYVEPRFRRRGVGRSLYVALIGSLWQLGYVKAYAGITLPNPASVGLHQAVGFEPVGVYRGVGYKLNSWHDVGWYQLPIQEERPAPAAPRSVTTIINSPEWFKALTDGLEHYRTA
jgi:phosphinothricin acetyltransferase